MSKPVNLLTVSYVTLCQYKINRGIAEDDDAALSILRILRHHWLFQSWRISEQQLVVTSSRESENRQNRGSDFYRTHFLSSSSRRAQSWSSDVTTAASREGSWRCDDEVAISCCSIQLIFGAVTRRCWLQYRDNTTVQRVVMVGVLVV